MIQSRAWIFAYLLVAMTLSPVFSGEPGRLSRTIDEAEARIDVLRDRSDDYASLTELGWLLYRYGRDGDGAMQAVQAALRIDSDGFKANELAGRINYLRGRDERALDHWLKLVDHDRPEVQLYLGAIFGLASSRGEIDRAVSAMERVSSSHPNHLFRMIADRALAEHLLANGRIDEAQAKLHHMGIIENWRVIGPFANERHAGYSTIYGPENEIDFDQSYIGRDRAVAWRVLDHLTFRGFVDFGAVMYPREQVLGYAVTFLNSPDDRDATLRLGVRETVKVWFNEREVYASDLERGFAEDQVTIPIRLRRGCNKLLVKIGVEEGVWRMAMRLTNPNGRPMPDVASSRETCDSPGGTDIATPTFDYSKSMIDHFSSVLEGDPDNEDALYYLGLGQQGMQLMTEASKTFERLVRLNDRCGDHHRLVARAYLSDDKAEKALEEIKAGLEVDPRNLQLRLMLARFYNSRRMFEQESVVLEEIEAQRPDWRELAYQWVSHYNDRGWEEPAFRKAKKLYEDEPTDLRALTTYARMCQARGYTQLHEKLLQEILDVTYINTYARRERLARAVGENRVDEALEMSDAMIRLDPIGVEARLERARYLTTLRRHEDALAVCKRALEICPEDFSVHREIGIIEQRQMDDDAARQAFAAALKFKPDDRWLREYLEFLDPIENAAFERYALGPAEVDPLMAREVSPQKYPRSDSVLILDEMVTQVFEDGSSTYRIHQIAKVLDDAGREQWTRVPLPRAANRVERAVVIQPDGREIEATTVTNTTIHFAQLQPGSIVDFVVTGYAQANDWMSREYSEIFFLQSPDPMLRSRFVLLTPHSKPVNTWTRGDMVTSKREEFEGQDVYIWEATDVPRIHPEPNAPPIMDLCAQVRVSTIKTWEEIARWEHSLIKEQFEPDHDLLETVRETTDGLPSTYARVQALANLVSEEIQYKIVRGGIFGYKPNKAANVLHNEWGDCKDKATLLITMLDAIDIEARYATLRTRDQGELVGEIPSNQCNHAIVYVPEQDDLTDPLWVDGTALELGIDSLPWMDQGVTAMVWDGEGHMTLKRTPLAPPGNTASSFEFNVTLRPDGGAAVDGRWTTTGQIAGAIRGVFKQPGQRAERLTQVLNSFAPGSVLADYEFSELENRDIPVEIDLKLMSSNYAVAIGDELTLRFKRPFRATTQFAPRDVRYYDVWLAYRQTQTFEESFRVPEGFDVVSSPQSQLLSTPWAEYTATVTKEGRQLRVRRELAIKEVTIPKDDYTDFREFCIALDEYEEQSIVIRKSGS